MKGIWEPLYLFLFFCAVSAAILATTFGVEYVFDTPPCNLCLLERIPYGLAGVLGLIGIYSPFRALLWLLLGVFLGSVVLSAYHLAIVYHWLDIPTLCTKPFFSSTEALLASDTITPCDRSPFNVLGAPLALWNLAVSGGLAGICGYGIFRR